MSDAGARRMHMATAPTALNGTVPPMNLDAEAAVLGAILLEGASALGAVRAILFAEDFEAERHRVIFRAMTALADAGAPVDLLMVQTRLRDNDDLALVGGSAKLAQCIEAGATAAYLPEYAGLIVADAKRRSALAVMQSLVDTVGRPRPEEAIDEAMRALEEIRARGGTFGAEPKVLIGPALVDNNHVQADWIVQRIFSAASQHMIVGASQSAKTWMLKDFGIAIAHDDVSEYLGQNVRRHGVCVVESWEDGQPEDLRKLSKLMRGHGLHECSRNLILISDPPATLSDPAYFERRKRDLVEWGAIAYLFDSLSEAAGTNLNDNEVYSEWWRARVKPLLELGIMVVFTHLKGHPKPGVGQNRDSASRGATQIRALSTAVLEMRQLDDVRFQVRHNKHRDGTALPFGMLELEGRVEDDFVRLGLKADDGAATKDVLARRLLRQLGAAQADDRWLDRRAIEAALNGKDRDRAERVSRKVWEPILAELTEQGLFQQSKRGNATTWRWIGGDGADGDGDAPF